jgi:hypothetical protein
VSTRPADPVAAHVAALERVLRGPTALRRDVLAEVRDGLEDAAQAHRTSGAGAEQAATRAVAEFGPVAELAPLYQAELTTAQVRRTALVAVLLFPALLLGWDLLKHSGLAWPAAGPVPAAVPVLARVQDVLSATTAGLALAVLLATLRRRARPRLLAAVAAGVALGGTVLCVGTAVVMNVANGPAAVAMLTGSPAAVLAAAASAVAAAAVSASALRTLRLARLPDGTRRTGHR